MTENVCPWCGVCALVPVDGYPTCPDCRLYRVAKGGPGWDEAFGGKIGDHYWRMCPPPAEERLVNIEMSKDSGNIKP